MARGDVTAIEPYARSINQHPAPVAVVVLHTAREDRAGRIKVPEIVQTQGLVQTCFALREGEQFFADL